VDAGWKIRFEDQDQRLGPRRSVVKVRDRFHVDQREAWKQTSEAPPAKNKIEEARERFAREAAEAWRK
jgi:hypothetical protein